MVALHLRSNCYLICAYIPSEVMNSPVILRLGLYVHCWILAYPRDIHIERRLTIRIRRFPVIFIWSSNWQFPIRGHHSKIFFPLLSVRRVIYLPRHFNLLILRAMSVKVTEFYGFCNSSIQCIKPIYSCFYGSYEVLLRFLIYMP